MTQPAHGKAAASIIVGIIGVICWFFGYSSLLSIILGVVGVVLASKAKKEGNTEGMRTGGLILSIVSLVGGIIAFIVTVVVVGAVIGGLAVLGSSV